MKRIISNSVLLFCLSFCFLALPVSCSSSSATGTHVGYEYVDLGLSVKWATCNVGASSPEGYGSYFAWGETSPKSEYNWRNLKYCTEVDEWDNAKFSKYVAESEYGRVDNKTSLELDDDAASANWGGSWRMPTKEEFQELIYNCNWKWTTKDGQNGYKVVSKVNGKSIFLPAAGWRDDTYLNRVGSGGSYWSSSLYGSICHSARYLDFNSVDCCTTSSFRGNGFPVRPVLDYL